MEYHPDISLKTTFDGAAELYQEARPSYPKELFEKLIEVTKINLDTSRVLEIGSGPGKATISMAERGYKLIGLEPGKQLAHIARRLLRDFHRTTIFNTTFEDADLTPDSYDLVFAASSFHWVDPNIRWTKSHRLLKPGGYLALIGGGRISDEKGDLFFTSIKEVMERCFRDNGHMTEQTKKAHEAALEALSIPPKKLEELLAGSPGEYDEELFEVVYHGYFPEVQALTVEQVLKLLGTYSMVICMDEKAREKFYAEMRKEVEEKFNGIVERIVGNKLVIFRAK